MIHLKNVSKSYKKKIALENFSYDFKENIAYGVLGINGAGKSTLINCITKNISYKGNIDYEDLSRWEIGYVPQELAIYKELSVKENLEFFASAYRLERKEAKKRSEELIKRVGLWDKKDALPKDLSGGMKRKLNLITGLVHNPRFLICDEVCVGIDIISRKEILEYLKELLDSGLTMIYTSHYLDEIEYLCDRIIFLNQGKLILEGDKSELVKTICDKGSNLSDLFLKVLREESENIDK